MQARDALNKAAAELDKAAQSQFQIDQAKLHQSLAENWTEIAKIIADHPECA